MNEHKDTGQLISMRNVFIVVYSIIAIGFFVLTCAHFVNSKNHMMLAQSENYTTVAARQSARNLFNYCRLAESGIRLVYDDPAMAEFYPLAGRLTPEEISYIEDLTETMTKASFVYDFADLGIIYSTGDTAGIVSDGTKALFGSDVFGRANVILTNQTECWTAFFSGNLSRACYLRRLNQHAIFVASFYATRIGSVFNTLAEDSSLMLCVTDRSDRIIYSSDNMPSQAGERLPADILEPFDGKTNITVGTEKGASCSVELENGWRVYAVARPDRTGRFDDSRDETFIIIVGLSVVFFTILSGFLIAAFFTGKRRKKKSVNVETDDFFGVLTPFYCEEHISDLIETSLVGGTWAFSLVRIKDIEIIRERLGDEFVRGGQKMLADILKEGFGDSSAIGINSRDDFVVFSDFSDFDIFKAHTVLRERIGEIKKQFGQLLVGDEGDFKLDAAMGVCIYPDHGKDYDELDAKASKALKQALAAEGDSLVFFEEHPEGKRGGAGR